MNWYLVIGLALLACLALAGWAVCKVGGDADDRAGYDRDEHQGGLPL